MGERIALAAAVIAERPYRSQGIAQSPLAAI
jgi:hypothetical protein